jgi:F0F1-type ATP synthase membrane subunit c/vacuolar-type H+-ATPase subunit K
MAVLSSSDKYIPSTWELIGMGKLIRGVSGALAFGLTAGLVMIFSGWEKDATNRLRPLWFGMAGSGIVGFLVGVGFGSWKFSNRTGKMLIGGIAGIIAAVGLAFIATASMTVLVDGPEGQRTMLTTLIFSCPILAIVCALMARRID